jgi:hypothetical protein
VYQMILRRARLEDGAVDVGIEDARIGRVALLAAVHRAARLPERDADGRRPRVVRVGTLFGDVDPGPAQEGPTHADVTDPELTGLRGPLQFTEKVRG